MDSGLTEIQGKIDKATEFKNAGNVHFRNGELVQARKNYAKVFLYVEGLVSAKDEMSKYAKNTLNEEMEVAVLELKQTTLTNMALIDFKLGNFQKSVERATKALDIGWGVKAAFRRGLAYMELNDLDRAQTDLETAQQESPDDPGIQQAIRNLQAKFRAHQKREQKKFGGFFDKLSMEEEKEEEKKEEN